MLDLHVHLLTCLCFSLRTLMISVADVNGLVPESIRFFVPSSVSRFSLRFVIAAYIFIAVGFQKFYLYPHTHVVIVLPPGTGRKFRLKFYLHTQIETEDVPRTQSLCLSVSFAVNV